MHPLKFWLYILALSVGATLLSGSIHAASAAGKPVVPAPVTKKPVVKMSAMQQEMKHGSRRIMPLPGSRITPLPGFHFPRGKKGR